MNESLYGMPEGGCFITDTNYTRYFTRKSDGKTACCMAPNYNKCQYMKLYANDVITFSAGGLYQFADNIEFAAGGGGGYGHSHSQGMGSEHYFVMRKRNDTGFKGFDYYELRDGKYTFGYYDCGKIVQGGAIDDFKQHYYCSAGVNLFEGCNRTCWGQGLQDYRRFNYTSTLFGSPDETTTSQVFY